MAMQNITEPTLLLNENICKNNIQRMAERARHHGLLFKPHMKTHQSAVVGTWLKDNGVEAITVSSLQMAEYFASHGWKDITIAFPCNIRQINQINKLAGTITLTLLVNSELTVKKLEEELSHSVKVYIELDTGSGRTGLATDQIPRISQLIQKIQKTEQLEWVGFYSHPGHSYDARSEAEIQAIHKSVKEQCLKIRSEFESKFRDVQICVGDTPCCSKGEGFDGIDAISPGNFVFYDLMQYQIGSCRVSDIAVSMICPVVDKFPERNELAIHGGAIHFSKESLNLEAINCYGLVAEEKGNSWEITGKENYLKNLSQEHGIVKCTGDIFNQYDVGDLITILPVHSCLTANLMKTYSLSDGTKIEQMSH